MSIRPGISVHPLFVLLGVAALSVAVGTASGTAQESPSSSDATSRGVRDAAAQSEAGASDDESGDSPEQSLRDRVEYLLSGYHFEPNPETFEKLGSEAEIAATLRTIAADASARPSLRTRAVDVLAEYDSEATRSFLKSRLEPPDETLSKKRRRAYRVVRLHAITSVAELHGGERTVELLEGLLEAEDLQVRLMVVAALGRHGGDAGRKRLREFAEQTEDDTVLREIRRYVDLE